MTDDSEVIDTGSVDAYGYPIYQSNVVVAPQLLLQRGLTPATDGGFASGHTNAFFLAGLAFAYAVPERFQELVTRAYELADTRVVAGMHSVVDVVGGRILATALAAAILNDPANAGIKAAARNDIDGAGGLVKAGTGALTLTGTNRYSGGTRVLAGTLVAGSPNALGCGDVQVSGGTLRVASDSVRVRGDYTQAGILAVSLGGDRTPALIVERATRLGRGSVLAIQVAANRCDTDGGLMPVISTRWLTGRFDTIMVTTPGLRAEPRYTATGLFVRLIRSGG